MGVTFWIIVGGILLLTLLALGLSALSKIGRPPIDGTGLSLPRSGAGRSSMIEAYEKAAHQLAHAHQQHNILEGIFKFLVGWLGTVKVPFVSHDKRYTGILLLICLALACSVGIPGIYLSFNEWKAANLPEAVPATGPLQQGESRDLIPDMSLYGVYALPGEILEANMVYSLACVEKSKLTFGFAQTERQVEVILFVGDAEASLSPNGEELIIKCASASQIAIKVLPGLPAAPTQIVVPSQAPTQIVEQTPAAPVAVSSDVYGNSLSIWKSDRTIGETGSFWQPLSQSGMQYYRNGLIIAEQTCGQVIYISQITSYLANVSSVSNVSVVVNLPDMAGANPMVIFDTSNGTVNVTHPLACIYTIVYYP